MANTKRAYEPPPADALATLSTAAALYRPLDRPWMRMEFVVGKAECLCAHRHHAPHLAAKFVFCPPLAIGRYWYTAGQCPRCEAIYWGWKERQL